MTTSLVLRCVRSDFTSRAGFRWPRPGEDLGHGPGVVACPDWSPEPVCGKGLHGWLRGEGDPDAHGEVNPSAPSTVWLVVEVETSDVVAIDGKVKFPRGTVLVAGSRQECHTEMLRRGQLSERALWRMAEVGDRSTLTGGNHSSLTGGYRSTLTGGYRSTLTGGHCSTLAGGHYSTLTGGDGSTLTGGTHSLLTGGYRSTLTAGDHSTLAGGYRSTLTGGDGSVLICRYYCGGWKVAVAVVDGSTIKSGVAYRYNVERSVWEEVT